jgi:hypothetical protein
MDLFRKMTHFTLNPYYFTLGCEAAPIPFPNPPHHSAPQRQRLARADGSHHTP